MAYPLYELVNRTGVRNANAFALVLEDLEKARLLRRQERLETKSDRTEWEPYYELYHDLFAKPVNDWNRDYKISRARRRTLFGGTGAAAGALLLYAAWNIVYQRTHDHLRLAPSGRPVGPYRAVERHPPRLRPDRPADLPGRDPAPSQRGRTRPTARTRARRRLRPAQHRADWADVADRAHRRLPRGRLR
jgi:hypothetical protein